MKVDINDLGSYSHIAEATGWPAHKIRMWYARNHHGLADLCDRPNFRPPLYRMSSAPLQRWIANHMNLERGADPD